MLQTQDNTKIVPAQDDLPLELAAPMPTFVNGGSESPFGFKPNLVSNQGHSKASKVVRHTNDDEVPDSEPDADPRNTIGFVTIFIFLPLF